MTSDHTCYEELASPRRSSDEYRQGRAEAERAYLPGSAVRERRLALGLSQVELATRVGMTQPALSRLEAGGVTPTIPLWTGSPPLSTPTSSSRLRHTAHSTQRTCRAATRSRATATLAACTAPAAGHMDARADTAMFRRHGL